MSNQKSATKWHMTCICCVFQLSLSYLPFLPRENGIFWMNCVKFPMEWGTTLSIYWQWHHQFLYHRRVCPLFLGVTTSANLLWHHCLFTLPKTGIWAACSPRQIGSISNENSLPYMDGEAVPEPMGDTTITRIVSTVIPHVPEGKIWTIAAAISSIDSNTTKV